MYKCKYCGKEFDKALSLGGHITKCLLNPNRVTNKGKKIDQSYNNVTSSINLVATTIYNTLILVFS